MESTNFINFVQASDPNQPSIFDGSFAIEDDSSDSELGRDMAVQPRAPSQLFKNAFNQSQPQPRETSSNNNIARWTHKTFEKESGTDVTESDVEVIQRETLAIPESTERPKNIGSSTVAYLVKSYGLDEFSDVSWMKDSDKKSEEVIVFQDGEFLLEDTEKITKTSTEEEESQPLNDTFLRRQALIDITKSFSFAPQYETEHIESLDSRCSESSALHRASLSHFNNPLDFTGLFENKGVNPLVKSSPKSHWLLKPTEKKEETRGRSKKDGIDQCPEESGKPPLQGFHKLKLQVSQSKLWTSMKSSSENKENEIGEIKRRASISEISSILLGWRKASAAPNTTPNASPSTANRHGKQVSPISKFKESIHHEGSWMKEKRKELAEHSTRSIENWKHRGFDSFKHERHHFTTSVEEQEHPPGLRSLFVRTFTNANTTFDRENESTLSSFKRVDNDNSSEKDGPMLKIVDNKLKVQKPVNKFEMRTTKSLEILCQEENIEKTEVLKRMEDGSIKVRQYY